MCLLPVTNTKSEKQIIGPLTAIDLDIPEVQGSPTEVATIKCQVAAHLIGGPVIIEDTSLCFHALNGMPGPYIKTLVVVKD